MALARWPASLPQYFLRSSYSEGTGKSVIRSEMDTGPAKLRRRSRAVVRPVDGSLLMTGDQYETFVTFVENTIGGGALPFEFPHQRRPGEFWLVRLADPDVMATPKGPLWQVQLKIEVLP